MSLDDNNMERLLCDMHTVVIISDPDSNTIIAANAKAMVLWGDNLIGKTACSVYGLSGSVLSWYHSLEHKAFAFDFRLFTPPAQTDQMILDCTFLQMNSQLLRVDTFCHIGETDPLSYYYKFEMVSQMQRWNNYALRTTSENIGDLPTATLFLYAADRAFVLEVDPEVDCVVYIFSKTRSDLDCEIQSTRSTDSDGVSALLSFWESGQAIYESRYEKQQQSPLLAAQLYNNMESWSYMLVPFSRQSGIRCFLCADNVRRFTNNASLMRTIALLIANEMYADRMRDSASAARRLSSRLSHTPEKLVQIYMFGGLRVQTSLGIQAENHFFSSQCGTFFVYLLSNRHRMVPVRELAEILWPEELIDNPYNMVKNVAFRTRKMFDNICAQTLITAGNGTYSINKNLDIWLDTEEFELLYRKASSPSASEEQRLDACKKAMLLYSGSMLPNFDAETWLMARISYYQLLFIDLIKMYLTLLRNRRDFRSMFRVVARANELEEIDSEIHMILLEALIENKKLNFARNYYNKVKKQLSGEEDRAFWDLYQNAKQSKP